MLTKNFKRKEFECKCGCGQDTVDYMLLKILEDVREHFNQPVTINSGNRCYEYNKRIGGSAKSQHTKGKAADIVVKGVKPQEVYDYLNDKYPKTFGMGNYKTFTHIDSRNLKARW